MVISAARSAQCPVPTSGKGLDRKYKFLSNSELLSKLFSKTALTDALVMNGMSRLCFKQHNFWGFFSYVHFFNFLADDVFIFCAILR
jgi:hypothetical protein